MAEKITGPNVYLRENDKSLIQKGPITTGAAIVGPTVKGIPLVPTVVTSYSEYQSVFGETFKSGSNYYEYLTSLTAKEYFSGGGQSLLVTKIISGSNYNTFAKAFPEVSGSVDGSIVENSSFTLEVLSFGDDQNNTGSISSAGALSSGSAYDVRWEVSSVDYTKGTFSLIIRRGDDVHNNKNVLETFSNVNLDPQSPNFISRVIGNQKPRYIASDGGYVQYDGEYTNSSEYVRVSAVPILHVDSIDNDGNFKSEYSSSLPIVGSGSYGGSFDGGVAPTNRAGLYFENITTINSQGFSVSDYELGITLLGNKDEYDFNLLFTPGIFMNSTAISTCESRADAFAVVDPIVYSNGTKALAATAAAGSTSSYGGVYWPWVQIFSAALGKSVWVPASVVMAGVFAFNDQVGAEWFAPAGFTRGSLDSVTQIQRKLSASDRGYLYDANVNPLATFPGNGVVVFGQKTLQKRATSLNRVNVRRLLITMKRYVGQVGRQLIFEQNTNVTRNRFLSTINPYMEQLVQKQGLYAYKVVMDETNNTADVIDRNQLVGQIYVQPTRTAEFIILDFTLLPTGVVFPE